MEIVSCMKGGMIENWDLFEEILDYTLKKVGNPKFWDFLFTIQFKRLHSESEYHPLLMSEPAWNTKEKREKLMELVFEKFNAPGKGLYFEICDCGFKNVLIKTLVSVLCC